MQYENGKSQISQGVSHIRLKKKKNDCAWWKMHPMEKAREKVMWGVQFRHNVQIVEEEFLKTPKKARFPNMLCQALEGGFTKVWPSWNV